MADVDLFDGLVTSSATLLQVAIDASPTGLLVVDTDGRIRIVNAAIERQFGYSRAELVGQPVETLLPEALRGTRGGDQPVLGRRKDGTEFAVEIGLNPVKAGGGRFVVATVIDLSERRPFEIERASANDQRQEFERLIAELSIQFIRLPSQELSSIEAALGRLAESLDVDRSSLWLKKNGDFVYAAGWTRDGFSKLPAGMSGVNPFPWMHSRIVSGEAAVFSTLEELPEPDRGNARRLGVKSSVAIPLVLPEGLVGSVSFAAMARERAWSADVVNRMRMVGSVIANLLARREAEQNLHDALAEVSALRDRLQAENVYLRREVQERLGSGRVTGNSPAIRRLLELVHQVAATDSTVLLLGETGTGKEMLAAEIHRLSARSDRELVRVNCAAIPSTLMESELFGREKGAYTGAMTRQIGRFELADHGTIFLDEIGDLSPEIQVKLLRVIEEKQLERLGSPRPVRVDTRIIAATHRDLEERIAEGFFRDDLYYRLNVFPIRVPPLRERVEDIPLLVWRFIDEFAKAFGKRVDAVGRDNMTALQQYSWPGNVRELRNVVERAMIGANGPRLTIAVPDASAKSTLRSDKIHDVEREHIRAVLLKTGWRIRGNGGAAERLGLPPTTLETRMAKLGLKRPERPSTM